MGFIGDLLLRHSSAWLEMTQHAFLRTVADGELDDASFARWLEQDYHFVAGLIGFVVGLRNRLPEGHSLAAPLAGAVDVLQSELDLFEREAANFGAQLGSAELSPTCFNYLNFLFHVRTEQALPVAILVYWALEQAYFDGWTYVASTGNACPGLAGFVSNWTSPLFGEYVELLRFHSDAMLQPEHHAAAEAAFLRTVQFEYLFWQLGIQRENWPLEGGE